MHCYYLMHLIHRLPPQIFLLLLLIPRLKVGFGANVLACDLNAIHVLREGVLVARSHARRLEQLGQFYSISTYCNGSFITSC